MSARRWLLLAAGALALLVGWHLLAPGRALDAGPTSASRARPAVRPAALAHRAPPAATPSPAPTGVVRTGIAACDDYIARAMRCDQLPDDARIAIGEASKAWAAAASADRPALEDSCRATASVQQDALAAMGC